MSGYLEGEFDVTLKEGDDGKREDETRAAGCPLTAGSCVQVVNLH